MLQPRVLLLYRLRAHVQYIRMILMHQCEREMIVLQFTADRAETVVVLRIAVYTVFRQHMRTLIRVLIAL